jgi:hypothetical protein
MPCVPNQSMTLRTSAMTSGPIPSPGRMSSVRSVMVKRPPQRVDPWRMAQPFMGRDPDRQARQVGVGEQLDHIGAALGDGALSHADPGTRQDKMPIGHLVVTAEREAVARHGQTRGAEALDDQVAAVIADEVMVEDVLQPLGPSAPRDVALRGIKPDRQVAQMPRDHVELRGPVHAKRDVGLVEQEVLGGVAGHEFHGQARVRRRGTAARIGGRRKLDTTCDAVRRSVPVSALTCPAA